MLEVCCAVEVWEVDVGLVDVVLVAVLEVAVFEVAVFVFVSLIPNIESRPLPLARASSFASGEALAEWMRAKARKHERSNDLVPFISLKGWLQRRRCIEESGKGLTRSPSEENGEDSERYQTLERNWRRERLLL